MRKFSRSNIGRLKRDLQAALDKYGLQIVSDDGMYLLIDDYHDYFKIYLKPNRNAPS
jgi:hypothetical protein